MIVPKRTKLAAAEITNVQEVQNHIGVFDDDGVQELLEDLRQQAEQAVRLHFNRPLRGDTLTCWYKQWPSAKGDAFLAEGYHHAHGVRFAPDTTVTGFYYNASNTREPIPQDLLIVDPTNDARVVCKADFALSTDFAAPIELTFTNLDDADRIRRCRGAIFQAVRLLYNDRNGEQDSQATIRSTVSQLLATGTLESI